MLTELLLVSSNSFASPRCVSFPLCSVELQVVSQRDVLAAVPSHCLALADESLNASQLLSQAIPPKHPEAKHVSRTLQCAPSA